MFNFKANIPFCVCPIHIQCLMFTVDVHYVHRHSYFCSNNFSCIWSIQKLTMRYIVYKGKSLMFHFFHFCSSSSSVFFRSFFGCSLIQIWSNLVQKWQAKWVDVSLNVHNFNSVETIEIEEWEREIEKEWVKGKGIDQLYKCVW